EVRVTNAAAVRTALEALRAVEGAPAPPAAPLAPAQPAAPAAAPTPTTSVAWYRQEYGIEPERHVIELARHTYLSALERVRERNRHLDTLAEDDPERATR